MRVSPSAGREAAPGSIGMTLPLSGGAKEDTSTYEDLSVVSRSKQCTVRDTVRGRPTRSTCHDAAMDFSLGQPRPSCDFTAQQRKRRFHCTRSRPANLDLSLPARPPRLSTFHFPPQPYQPPTHVCGRPVVPSNGDEALRHIALKQSTHLCRPLSPWLPTLFPRAASRPK